MGKYIKKTLVRVMKDSAVFTIRDDDGEEVGEFPSPEDLGRFETKYVAACLTCGEQSRHAWYGPHYAAREIMGGEFKCACDRAEKGVAAA